MAIVNQVDKKAQMNSWQIVKYQILTYCYINNIQVNDSELDCLTHLAINGEQELTSFCNAIYESKIFSSSQSARNCLTKLEKKRMILKEGKNKKRIFLNPLLDVQAKGNILLNYKFLSVVAP